MNALDIARFLVQKHPRPWCERAPAWDAIKNLDRQIATFTKQHNMTLNPDASGRTEMAKVAPEIEQAMGNPISQQVLAHYPTAEALKQAPMEKLLARLKHEEQAIADLKAQLLALAVE